MDTHFKKLEGKRTVLRFGNTPGCPDNLYLVGNTDALRMPCLAVVGCRKASPYESACIDLFVPIAIERGFCILTGGAIGVATHAHEIAVKHDAISVAVLGSGIDEYYPKSNGRLFQQIVDSGGAIVSEQEWNTPTTPNALISRNRIIAGLASGVLCVGASMPSGNLTLCDDAISMGTPVLAVPGSIFADSSKGTNAMIAHSGATPITSAQDMYEALERIRDSRTNAA